MISEYLATATTRFARFLPRGALFIPRTLARVFPNLREYPVKTRYGRVYCDLRESVCVPLVAHGEYRWWRPDEEALARLPITKESVVLDVGANIGVTVRLFAARAGHVHAFEPAPRALRLLQRNVSDLGNVTLHTVALSNENGKSFFSELDALDNSTLAEVGIVVPVRTIDSYGFTPDVIKIDVEGFEHLVLEGARQTLQHSPIVIFEAFGETARQYCENIIRSANASYRFETMGGKTNHIAWPIN